MKVGQFAHYKHFIQDRLDRYMLIQLVKKTKDEYRFRIDQSDTEHLHVGKRCFPTHEWVSGEVDCPIQHKTIIDIIPLKQSDLETAIQQSNRGKKKI